MLTELRAREALRKHHFRQDTRLGQHFILDDDVLSAIVREAQVEPGDNVLEIGAGAGTLTAALMDAGAIVTAVEIDRALQGVLEGTLAPYANYEIIYEDILRVDLSALWSRRFGGRPARVVANLPYYITADVVTKLLSSALPIKSMCVMVQEESAQRMCAQPGAKNYGVLAVETQYRAQLSIGMTLPPEAFEPRPHIVSTLLHVIPWPEPPVKLLDEEMFFKTVRAAFFMRRKTLTNNLCAVFSMPRGEAEAIIEGMGLPAQVRGERLSLDELAKLADALSVYHPS